MITKLLCPTDGSKASIKGVEFACKFANQLNAELLLLTVDTITDDELSHTRAWSHVAIEAADEQTHKDLFNAEGIAKSNNVENFSAVSAQGKNIPATIIAFAEEHNCDHIIMGSTGKTGIARIMIGSVASDVVAKAHCPVTIIR